MWSRNLLEHVTPPTSATVVHRLFTLSRRRRRRLPLSFPALCPSPSSFTVAATRHHRLVVAAA
ncbi:hypothetical protein Hanom_Chr02g00136571 [Helianthus anomalus]